MCGISGMALKNKNVNTLTQLRAMTDSIRHRGPDGDGHWLNDDETIALGHRRLAIIDLSENGKQPMHYDKGRYTITYNGEIYNYIELKQELIKKGYCFFSETDTEVILALYAEYKEQCLPYLDGMFAFAIYDNKEKKLFCARDRFGEKPFFYYYKPGECFVFASEMKALFAYGIEKKVNNEMLYNYLQFSFVSHPHNKSQTFYTNINKLSASGYLTVSKDLHVEQKQYWDLNSIHENAQSSFEWSKEKFYELFLKSVKLRLRSDVPIGTSLSGGLDSSSIACAIHQLGSKKGITQNSFSARFKDYDRDEGEYIQKVIDKTGLTSHFVWPDETSFMDDFEKLVYYQEEPFPTASIYAQYSVMKKAKECGVIVLLDGQGADEILAGYEYYLQFYLNSLYQTDKNLYNKELKEIKNLHKHLQFIDYDHIKQNKSVALKITLKDILRPVLKVIQKKKYTRITNKAPLEGFLSKDFVYQFDKNIDFDFTFHGNTLNEYLKYSTVTNNLEDMLRFSDRNASAFSREVRLPFLSHELVEFLFSLPAQFKIQNGWTKYIQREAMKTILPDEITWRVDKIGYEPPQKKWMQNKAMQERSQSSFELLQKQGIVNKKAVLTEKYAWQVLASSALHSN